MNVRLILARVVIWPRRVIDESGELRLHIARSEDSNEISPYSGCRPFVSLAGFRSVQF